MRTGTHHEDLVVGPLEGEQDRVPFPHRQQAAAAVGEKSDVEQIESLADTGQGYRRDLLWGPSMVDKSADIPE